MLFSGTRSNQDNPATSFYSITPHDTNEIGDFYPKFIMCSGAGNITVVGEDGIQVVIPLLAGVFYPISPRIVKSTGTTATGLVAGY